MIGEQWIIAGALLNLIGGASYFIATIKGRVKPNKVTWLLWTAAPLIAFAAEVRQGVGLPALTTFMAGAGPLAVFCASFINKKSQWKISRFDMACGALSIIGIGLWLITRVGNTAIAFSIAADGLAAAPTIRKSYRFPKTEDYKVYFFAAISAAITLLAIKNWAFAYYGFPLYLLIISSILTFLIRFNSRNAPAKA